MLKTPLLWMCILLVTMLGYVYWPADNSNQASRSRGMPLVEVESVKLKKLSDSINTLGNVQANESVTVTAQSTDRVVAIHFDDGELVAKGQLLATLAHDEEQALVAELKVRLSEQKRQLGRLLDLKKQSASAESAIDSQTSLVDATSAQLQVAKIRLQEKFTYAPFAGKLGLRQISPGQLVKNDTVMTTLDDLTQVKVEFQLAEKYLSKVVEGQTVDASNVAFLQPFTGVIKSIDSRVDPVSRAFTVRAVFANQDHKLRPGMLLQLVIAEPDTEKMIVPEAAIVPLNQQHYVYVLTDEQKVIQTQVMLGSRYPGVVEVVSGLDVNQQVVTKGVLKVRDGIKVNLADKGKKQLVANKAD